MKEVAPFLNLDLNLPDCGLAEQPYLSSLINREQVQPMAAFFGKV